MPVLPILEVRRGNPDHVPEILCTPAREVTEFSPVLHRMAADLLATMRHDGAAGLAAPQAGIPLRLAVVEREGGEPLVLVNPRITAEGGPFSDGPEECLSVPGTRSLVNRPWRIRVSFQDLEGTSRTMELRGIPARVIAHEVDHLDGILCTDRAIGRRRGGEP